MGHQHVCRGGWSLGHGVMLAASEGDGVWDGNLPLAGKLQVEQREAKHLRAGRPPPHPTEVDAGPPCAMWTDQPREAACSPEVLGRSRT